MLDTYNATTVEAEKTVPVLGGKPLHIVIHFINLCIVMYVVIASFAAMIYNPLVQENVTYFYLSII